MFQYILFSVLIVFPFQSHEATTTEQPEIRCNIIKPQCPNGFCCARDEFLPEYTTCKHTGKVKWSCSTVMNEAMCPCETGLVCVPNVNSVDFVSIYGKCQKNITTIDSTVATTTVTVKRSTTILTTTTKQHKEHNHPPIIQFQNSAVIVSKFSKVGQTFSRFTVKDNDHGKNGIVQCSVIQPGFFKIEKVDSYLFQVEVASSLENLSPQALSALIICQDNGTPPLNGIRQVSIDIVLENVAFDTTTITPSTSVTTETINSKLQTVNTTQSIENSTASSSETSETSTSV